MIGFSALPRGGPTSSGVGSVVAVGCTVDVEVGAVVEVGVEVDGLSATGIVASF